MQDDRHQHASLPWQIIPGLRQWPEAAAEIWIMNASKSRQQRFFFFLCRHGCVFGCSWHEKILVFFNMLQTVYKWRQVSDNIPKLFCKHRVPLCVSIKWSNMADNGSGSVRTASWSSGAVLCASGNDLCHSASNLDLSLSAADSYAVYSHVIPLDSRCVCTQQHRPAGREDSVDASRCTELKFFWALPKSVNNMSRNKDGSLFLGFCLVISQCTAHILSV